jgi:hypothetical protein
LQAEFLIRQKQTELEAIEALEKPAPDMKLNIVKLANLQLTKPMDSEMGLSQLENELM